MTLGQRIEKFVTYAVPNKKEWKEKLGMGNNSLYYYFKGDTKPGYDLIDRLELKPSVKV